MKKLRNLTINRADLVDRGANPLAHITLIKRDSSEDHAGHEPTPWATIQKNAAARYGAPMTTAVVKYCTECPEGRELYRRHSAQTAAIGLNIGKVAAAAQLQRLVNVLIEKADIDPVQAWPLAAQMFPHAAAAYAGHGVLVRKAQPTVESLLEELAAHFADIQRGLHRVADHRAVQLTTTERRELVRALLDAYNNT